MTLLTFWVAVVTFLHPAPAAAELTAFIVSATPRGCELARAPWLEDPAVSVSACTPATLNVSVAGAVLRPSP